MAHQNITRRIFILLLLLLLLAGTAEASAPNITSWYNNITFDNSTSIMVSVSEPVYFNATANQGITTWNWTKDGVDQGVNYDNITLSWSAIGIKTVTVNGTNANGTTQNITWSISVHPPVMWNWTENPSTNTDIPYSIALDSAGNIYVTGRDGTPGNLQWRVRKLFPNGTADWVYTENPSGTTDIPLSVAIDGAGNLYVAGYDTIGGGPSQIRVRKLFPNGTAGWVYTNKPSGIGDQASSITVDSDGNIYFAGSDYVPGNKQWHVEKLFPNGTADWNYTENPSGSADIALSIANDSVGNLYIAGYDLTPGGDNGQWRVRKLFPNGTADWVYTENPSGGWDLATSVAIDSAGNLYVGGVDSVPGNSQWRVRKLFPNGTADWVYTEDPSTSNDTGYFRDAAYSLALDSENNIYVAGVDNSSGDLQWRVRKLFPNGTADWVYTQNPSTGRDEARSIALDSSGNIYVAGDDVAPINNQWRVVRIGNTPVLFSPYNNKTGDSTLDDITVDVSESVNFKVAADQSITTWNWTKDGVDQGVNYDNITLSWGTQGSKTLQVNATGDNGTSNTIAWNVTVQDITPPASITNLQNSTYAYTYINWTWTNPADGDFNHTMVYINGIWEANVSTPYYNDTGLNPDTMYNISTHTVDTNGNVNQTWVNASAQTAPSASPVIISYSPDPPPHPPPPPWTNMPGDEKTFCITVSQTVDVGWYINGTLVQENISVADACYTNTSAALGYWNVSAIASNLNGSAIRTWWWRVTPDVAPGWSWQQPLYLDIAHDGHSFIQDSNGKYIIATWLYFGNNYEVVLLNSSDGMDWSSPINITNHPDHDEGPFIFQDSNNLYWMVWESERSHVCAPYCGGCSCYSDDIYISNSTDCVNWSTPIRLTTDADNDWSPSLMQDSNGTYWVTWWNTGNERIYIINSTDGYTWSTPVQRPTGGVRSRWPNMIQDSNGTYWLVWSGHLPENWDGMKYMKSQDGVTWSEPQEFPFNTHTSNDARGRIIQDNTGKYWVVWTSQRSGNTNIWYSTSTDGDNWSTPSPITTEIDVNYVSSPRIIQDNSGRYWVVFYSTRTTEKGTLWVTHTGVTLTSPVDGEVWNATQNISWVSISGDYTNDTFSLYYSSDGGTSWNLIQEGIPADGIQTNKSYEWNTTSLADGDNYKIKIVRTNSWSGHNETDISENSSIDNMPDPSITSWYNNKTDSSLNLTINVSETVYFNATANQGITTWNWYKDGVDQSVNYDNITLSWPTIGNKTVTVNATNANGTSNTITWNVTVQVPCTTPVDNLYINSDTVLCSGTYNIPDAGANGVIIINANGITLDCNGTTINGTDSGYGIYNDGYDNVTIKNCTVTKYGCGIYLPPSSNNTLTNNTASGNSESGIFLESSSNNNLTNNILNSNAGGIYLSQSNNNTLTNNTANNNSDFGIYLDTSNNYNILTNNTASGNSIVGIFLDTFSNYNTLTNNNASNNTEYGIRLDTSDNNTLTNNTANSNSDGIGLLYSSSNNNITDNTANNNDNSGIYLSSSSNNTLTGNTVSDNLQYGIYLTNNGANNLLNYNNIYNNTAYNLNNSQTPDVNATYSWWGITNCTQINASIYDYQDKPSSCGNVSFQPFLNASYPGGSPIYCEDETPPASISNLANSTYAQTYINWTWTNPVDADFNHTMIYINGVFEANVSTPYYNDTGLSLGTTYNISTRTVDTNGNVNQTWVNATASTKPDTTPPASISNLQNSTYNYTYINWTWTNPVDADFNHTMVYINGILEANVSTSYYNDTGLDPSTNYTISTHTVDVNGNINQTWVNKSARTRYLTLADTAWPMFGGAQTHIGRSSAPGIGNPDLMWRYGTGSFVFSSPAIGPDDVIYVGSGDFDLYAVYSNGTKKWSYNTGNWIPSSPAIAADGTAYVGSGDGKLHAVYSNGTVRWTHSIGSMIYSSPAIGPDGTVYIGSDDDNLYAVYPNGTERWSISLGGNVVSSPAVGSDGIIYVGSYDNNLYAIYPNGTEKWSYATGGTVDMSSPAIGSDGTIYVGSYDNKLHAVYPNGTGKWTYSTGGMIEQSSPSIGSDGTVYIGSNDDKLHAVYPNGTGKWIFTTGGNVYSSPSIASDGTVYIGSLDKYLYAINSNGVLLWRSYLGDDVTGVMPGVMSSPAISSNGTVYIGSQDTGLYAFSNATTRARSISSNWSMYRHDLNHTGRSPAPGITEPNLLWKYKTGDDVQSSPAFGADGTVYVGSYDGKIYAMHPNGTEKWNYSTGSYYISSSPAVGPDGTVYVGSWDHFLYAIYPNGTLRWKYDAGGVLNYIKSSPAIGPDGMVYFGAENGKVYAVYPNGTGKWNYPTGDAAISSPAIGHDGTIYVGSNDDKMYALNPDGSKKWSYTTSGDVLSSPAIGPDGIIYFGSEDFYVYALYPNGILKWKYATLSYIRSSPAIGSDGIIYIGSNDNQLHAIYPNGTKKWSYTVGFVDMSSPAIAGDGTIYIGSLLNDLYAIHPNGTERWNYTTGFAIYSSPAISPDGVVYVGSNDNYLYSFEQQTSITGLINITYATTHINWTWSNPSVSDFNHTMIYIDGVLAANTSDEYYNATNLSPVTSYTISTHTVDTLGNINTIWVNHTATTEQILIILLEDSIVRVTVMGVETDYHHEIWLSSPEEKMLFGDSQRSLGQSKESGPYTAGSEVILYIEHNYGKNYSDTADCQIEKINDTTYILSFEDATDDDYNDVVLKVELLPVSTEETVYGVDLMPDEYTHHVETDESAAYDITITNTGNVEDTFDLDVVNRDADSVDFDTSAVFLEAGENVTRTMTVSDAGVGTYDVTVVAVSQGDPAEYASVTTTTVVTNAVSISAEPSSQTVDTAQDAIYSITVTNIGSKHHTFDITITNTTELASLNNSSVGLDAGASAVIELKVNSPDAGSYTTSVTASAQGDPSKEDSVTVTTLVTASPSVCGISLKVKGCEKRVCQQWTSTGNATYNLIITNIGNVKDTFTLSYTHNPKDAGVSFIPDSIITLDPMESTVITLNISGVIRGAYPVWLKATSTNDTNVSDDAKTITKAHEWEDVDISQSTVKNASEIAVNTSKIVNSTLDASVIYDSSIITDGSIIIDSEVYSSNVTNTTLEDVILEDAEVEDGVILEGNITLEGITFEIDTDDPIEIDKIIEGTDEEDGTIAGLQDNETEVDAGNSKMKFRIVAGSDYVGGSMVVTRSKITPGGVISIDNSEAYATIEASDNLENATEWIIITVYYDEAVVKSRCDAKNNCDWSVYEQTLRLRYFNMNNWETYDPPQGDVDTAANYVWANVTHFSIFAVAGSTSAKPTTTSPGRSGVLVTTPTATATPTPTPATISLEGLPTLTLLVKAAEEQIIPYLDAGRAFLSFTETDVTQIIFDLKNEISDAIIGIQKLEDKPVEIKTDVPEDVYSYLVIKTINMHDEVQSASIIFKVSKSWLTDNSISEDTMKLRRYRYGKWNALPTGKGMEDEEYVYYTSKVLGFSMFTAAGEDSGARVSLFAISGGEETVISPAPAPSKPTGAPVIEEAGMSNMLLIGGVIAVLMIVLLVVVDILYKKHIITKLR